MDHRITILGEAVNESVRKIEAIFGRAEIIDTSDAVLLRAGRRACERKAPFHREKNSIGDAILIEIYRDVLLTRPSDLTCAFVTHNKHDFSNMAGDEREPHPDLAELFPDARSVYALALGEVLNAHAPQLMEEVRWEFEYHEEPRLLSEILEAERIRSSPNLVQSALEPALVDRAAKAQARHKGGVGQGFPKAPTKYDGRYSLGSGASSGQED